jgi:hypothetical protein
VNVELLELAAAALGDLLAQVVFVGSATLELWITDPGTAIGAPDPRHRRHPGTDDTIRFPRVRSRASCTVRGRGVGEEVEEWLSSHSGRGVRGPVRRNPGDLSMIAL